MIIKSQYGIKSRDITDNDVNFLLQGYGLLQTWHTTCTPLQEQAVSGSLDKWYITEDDIKKFSVEDKGFKGTLQIKS